MWNIIYQTKKAIIFLDAFGNKTSSHLKLLVNWLFVQLLVQVNNKENTKAITD